MELDSGGDGAAGTREWIRPALLFVAVIAVLFAPALSPDAQFLYRDAGRMHAPVKRWIARELSHGRIPKWNPYEGTSLVSDPIHAVQHPFNLFLLLLPFDAGFKAWIFAAYLAAALGAYAWTRRLGADRTGAAVSGLAYACSGFLVSSSDNVTYLTAAAFAPWVLAAGHAFVAKGDALRLAWLMAASYACAAAGDPPAWAIAVALVPVLAAIRAELPRRVALLRGVAGALGAILAAAPILLPVARGLGESARAAQVDEIGKRLWNLHPLRLLEWLLPHLSRDPSLDTSNEILRVFTGSPAGYGPWVLSLYGGVTVLVLAAAATSLRGSRALLALAALFTWAAMGPHAGFAAIAGHLPVLSSLRYWEKLAVWPALFLAVLAGLGESALLAGRIMARRVVLMAAGAGGLAALALAVAHLAPLERWLQVGTGTEAAAGALAANVSDGALHALALAATLAAAVLLLRRPDGARMAAPTLLLVVAADLVSANVRAYRLATPPERLPPSALRTCLAASGAVPGLITPFHLEPDPEDGLSPFESRWRRGAQTLLPAWNAADRVRNASPYSALYPLRYALYEERVPLETRVAALGLFGFAFVAVPGDPSLLDRTVLRPPWRVVAADPKFGVLVSIPHRARAYLADSARSATAGEALAFAADPASVSSSVTVVEGDVPQGLTGGSAEIALDLPDEVRVRTRSIGPALLVLDDAFAAGWTAAVDGTTAAIHAANYLARAVRLDPGAHEVVFTYRVPMLSVGWAIALGAFALAIAGHAVEHRLGRAGSPREAGSSPTKAGSAPRDG